MKKIFLYLILCLFPHLIIADSFDLYPAYDPSKGEVSSMIKGVIELKVKLGQKVKKGQVLYTLNKDILNIERDYCQKHLDIMEYVIKRARDLIKKDAISYKDYQETVRDYYNAKLKLQLNKEEEDAYTYCAPFDGTVTTIVRYDSSGTPDNDPQVIVTKGKADVDDTVKAEMCTRWPSLVEPKVTLGQDVKKGDILFTCNTSTYIAQLKIDENKLSLAQKEVVRLGKLQKTNTASLVEFLYAKDDYNRTFADVEISKIKLKQCSVYAPFDGKVTRVYRLQGSGLNEGKPVVQLTKHNKSVEEGESSTETVKKLDNSQIMNQNHQK